MLEALLLGAVAGYAIAIPVGPIAILILRIGMRDGLRPAMAAGAGTATADLFYVTTAMLAGPALVSAIGPALLPARLVAAAVLFALAARGLTRPGLDAGQRTAAPARARRTYGTVLALTLLNPATVIYFASLAIGLPGVSTDTAARVLFAAAAVAASLSWQWMLALAGSALHGRMPARLGLATNVASALIIGGLAVKIAADAFA